MDASATLRSRRLRPSFHQDQRDIMKFVVVPLYFKFFTRDEQTRATSGNPGFSGTKHCLGNDVNAVITDNIHSALSTITKELSEKYRREIAKIQDDVRVILYCYCADISNGRFKIPIVMDPTHSLDVMVEPYHESVEHHV